MIELWRDKIEVEMNVIYDLINKKKEDHQDVALGIQLLGVVVANKLPLHTVMGSLNKQM